MAIYASSNSSSSSSSLPWWMIVINECRYRCIYWSGGSNVSDILIKSISVKSKVDLERVRRAFGHPPYNSPVCHLLHVACCSSRRILTGARSEGSANHGSTSQGWVGYIYIVLRPWGENLNWNCARWLGRHLNKFQVNYIMISKATCLLDYFQSDAHAEGRRIP